jgi:hypothetical protein
MSCAYSFAETLCRSEGIVMKKRRRLTRIVLATAVTAALGASGVYIAGASADETTVAGRLQAESYAAQSGAQTEGTGDADGGKNVGWLADGDWLRFDGVAVTGTALSARVASDNSAGGSIELHLGSQTGTLLATFPVARTGGWQSTTRPWRNPCRPATCGCPSSTPAAR